MKKNKVKRIFCIKDHIFCGEKVHSEGMWYKVFKTAMGSDGIYHESETNDTIKYGEFKKIKKYEYVGTVIHISTNTYKNYFGTEKDLRRRKLRRLESKSQRFKRFCNKHNIDFIENGNLITVVIED